eukprot:scaffold5429_cov32-Tisochrysis_lutea.AAC.2
MLSKTGARWTGRAGRTMVAWFPCRAGGGRGGHSSWATQPAACARTVPKTSSENKTEVGEQARRASRGVERSCLKAPGVRHGEACLKSFRPHKTTTRSTRPPDEATRADSASSCGTSVACVATWQRCKGYLGVATDKGSRLVPSKRVFIACLP